MEDELTAVAMSKVKPILQSLPDQAVAAHGYLIENFGQTATLAIYLAALALVLLALFRSVKFSFDLLRFVLVPTVAVSFLGSLLLSYSFLTIVPFAAIVFSTFLFLKG